MEKNKISIVATALLCMLSTQINAQTVNDQIRVTSTKNYDINVRGTGDFTGEADASYTLPLSILRTSAKPSSSGSYSAEVTPTTQNQVLVANQPPTENEGFDIQYNIPKNDLLLTAAKDVYTTQLIYSITAL